MSTLFSQQTSASRRVALAQIRNRQKQRAKTSRNSQALQIGPKLNYHCTYQRRVLFGEPEQRLAAASCTSQLDRCMISSAQLCGEFSSVGQTQAR